MIPTDRLILRPAADDALRALLAQQTDEEMKKAYGEMLAGCLAHPGQRLWYTPWMAELPSGKVIGDLCFKGLSADGTVEIGYGFEEAYWGKGYATEAVTALVAWAAAQEGVVRIEAEAEESNFASQRVLAKAGFLPNGQMGEEGPRYTWHGSRE